MGNLITSILGDACRFIVTSGLIALALYGCTSTQKLVNSEWYEIETEHFRIVTNDNPKQVVKLAIDLEKFRIFAKRYIKYSADQQKLTIYALDDRLSFKGVSGSESSRTVIGQFHNTAYGSFALINLSGNRALPDNPARQTLFHEYTHFLTYSGSQHLYPYWYSEGIAEVFSTVDFDENKVHSFGKMPFDRAISLNRERELPLDKLLSAAPGSLTMRDTRALYANGWMLAHWMIFDTERKKALDEYLEAYNAGSDPITSLPEALGMTFEELNEQYINLPKSNFGFYEENFSDNGVTKSPSVKLMDRRTAVAELAHFMAISEQGSEALENYIAYANKKQASSSLLNSALAIALTGEGNYSRAEEILNSIPAKYHGEIWYLEARAKNDLSAALAEVGFPEPRKMKRIRDKYIQLINANGQVPAYWHELAITMQVLGYPRQKYTEMLEQAYLRAPRETGIAWWYALELYLDRDRGFFTKVSQPLFMQIAEEDSRAQLQSMLDELEEEEGLEFEPEISGLGQLMSTYRKYSGNKALAMAVDYRGAFVAGFNEDGGSTQAEASQSALQACEEQRKQYQIRDRCELYAEGEVLVNSTTRM
ncbi:hypothetical protein ACJJI4_20730 [Microbulbifer sp. TRSA002]|uniref:hypothetical protein n=1 Tax=Microbulbifer sp. TRSA002 TaxID=3243382 RepID=UPI004039E040